MHIQLILFSAVNGGHWAIVESWNSLNRTPDNNEHSAVPHRLAGLKATESYSSLLLCSAVFPLSSLRRGRADVEPGIGAPMGKGERGGLSSVTWKTKSILSSVIKSWEGWLLRYCARPIRNRRSSRGLGVGGVHGLCWVFFFFFFKRSVPAWLSCGKRGVGSHPAGADVQVTEKAAANHRKWCRIRHWLDQGSLREVEARRGPPNSAITSCFFPLGDGAGKLKVTSRVLISVFYVSVWETIFEHCFSGSCFDLHNSAAKPWYVYC